MGSSIAHRGFLAEQRVQILLIQLRYTSLGFLPSLKVKLSQKNFYVWSWQNKNLCLYKAIAKCIDETIHFIVCSFVFKPSGPPKLRLLESDADSN